jgi:hypothetical protein
MLPNKTIRSIYVVDDKIYPSHKRIWVLDSQIWEDELCVAFKGKAVLTIVKMRNLEDFGNFYLFPVNAILQIRRDRKKLKYHFFFLIVILTMKF